MEHYGKEPSMYKGIWIAFLFLLLVPVFVYFFLYGFLERFHTDYPAEIIAYMSLGFASVVAVLFDLISWVTGFLNGLVSAMFRRVYNLFSNIKIFKGKAFKWYLEIFVRNGGFILWGFILILIASIITGVIGFYQFFSWYNANIL